MKKILTQTLLVFVQDTYMPNFMTTGQCVWSLPTDRTMVKVKIGLCIAWSIKKLNTKFWNGHFKSHVKVNKYVETVLCPFIILLYIYYYGLSDFVPMRFCKLPRTIYFLIFKTKIFCSFLYIIMESCWIYHIEFDRNNSIYILI